MTTHVPSRIAVGATGGMVLVGIIVALSALQTPAVRAVDEKVLREYAGVYRWEPGVFVYLQMWNEFTGFDKPGELVAFDESGEVRTLYPTDRDRFFAGPGMAVSGVHRVSNRVSARRHRQDRLAYVAARRRRPARTARRVEIEKREDVRFSSGDIQLTGTLISQSDHGVGNIPRSFSSTAPAPRIANTMLPWARFLIRRGMAVLGYDKRGVGGSTGRLEHGLVRRSGRRRGGRRSST